MWVPIDRISSNGANSIEIFLPMEWQSDLLSAIHPCLGRDSGLARGTRVHGPEDHLNKDLSATEVGGALLHWPQPDSREGPTVPWS